MADQQVAPELKPVKTKLEGIIGELKQLQGSGTPTQAQVTASIIILHGVVGHMCAVSDGDHSTDVLSLEDT